jgi:iron complex outermembrane receptor protein
MNTLIAHSVRCGLAAAAALLSIPTAQAQQAPPVMAPAASGSLEEVLVTARRREESLQDVPIAVSAFSAEELRLLQAEDLAGLQGSVPNLNLVQGRGSANSANIFIRGIGQPDALQTFDPGVGVYIDDVYVARIQGALFNLYDVERVEVLRGPQGTLYGKNTIAGAIRLISRRPPEELAGQAELGYGDYDYFSAKGYLGGPVTENFGASLAGVYVTRSGVTEDPSTGRDYNDLDTAAGRVILEWDPTENLNVNLAADYTRSRNALNLGRPEAALIQVNLLPGVPPKVLQPAPKTPWDFKVATSFTGNEGQQLDNWGTALTIGWELSDAWLLKSITAYRSLEPDNYIDIDASIYELGDVFVGVDQNQTSQEFQLLYSGDRLEAVFGLYYFAEDIASDQTAWADSFLALGAIPITFKRTVADDLNTDSYAAFGQATWKFTDRLSGTVGLRYTDESKDYFRTTTTFFGAPLQAAGSTFEYEDDDSWSAWTPSFALDYRLSDETLLYVSAAEGFKSGGFNGRANTPGETGSFDPEYVWTYEVGAKNTLADGRLRLNADVFYSDYTDFQARVSEVIDPDAPVPNFSFPVLNAGALDIYGAELEMTWIPIDALSLQAQIGYLNADYSEFTASTVIGGKPVEIDRSKENPPFAPEWTARIGVAYTFALAEKGGLTFSTDVLYRDKQWLSVDNRDVLTQDSYALMNVLLSWASPSNAWYASAGIKNLTDEVYKVDAQEFSSVGNIQTAYYGDPQTWQFILGYRF